MGVPINNVSRRVVYAASGTGPYAFTFEILAAADIAVYKDDTLLTLTTDYTVTINANGTGSITLTASPTGATQIAIVGNRTIQRLTDFVTGGDLFANTINDELDQQTIFAQQNAEGLDRSLKAPQTDPTSINMTLPRASVRANKTLAFDTNGNPTTGEVIGDNRGNWAAGTAYNKRDIVKDTSNGNIYYANTAHTSSGSQPISSNADSAKWDLIVDNAAAGASASAAAASASAAASSASAASTSASNASSSASSAASSASAASTSASNASTSATNAASSASTASTQASNASTSATNAANSATSASNSASTATTQATNASNSASSASTSATNAANSASSASSSASSASSSASSASTSASNAASSATAAAASATSAAASYDSFDDRYLGAKTSDPTLDNDGNALLTGALYFNSSTGEMKVYSGSAWVSSFLTAGAQTIAGVKTFASNPILNAGTANGVAYLNGSKVLTTGSALSFDGTNLFNDQSTASPIGIRLRNGSTSTSAGTRVSFEFGGSTTGYVGNQFDGADFNNQYQANRFHIWLNGASETMRLTSASLYTASGINVGIGTSSPGNKLTVKPSATSNGTFDVLTGSTNTDSIRLSGGGTVNSWLELRGYLGVKLYSDSTNTVTVDSSGNLGLGVTPSAWGSAFKVLQLANGTSLSNNGQTSYYQIGANNYFDGTNYRYIASNFAGFHRFSNAGAYEWHTAPSWNGTGSNTISFTQAMTLDASGNFYVGTTSQSGGSNITFNQPANADMKIAASVSTGTRAAYQVFINNAVTTVGTENSTGGSLASGTAAYATVLANNSAYPICFATNNTERARITSGGFFKASNDGTYLGSTGGYHELRSNTDNNNAVIISSNATNGTQYGLSIRTTNDQNDATRDFLECQGGGVLRAQIRTNGGLANYSANDVNLSDQRLKTDVQPAGSYLDKICAIPVKTYLYKDQTDTERNLGVMAQDVDAVAPELIDHSGFGETPEGKSPYLAVYQTDLQYALMKCIQELKVQNDDLRARVAQLEAK